MLSRRAAIVFGVADALTALVLAVGVFGGLPSRWWPVGQFRRSLALLLRHQLGSGTAHLMADPTAVLGAIPSTEADWELRIDFAQHAGDALIAAARWLREP
jgi:hypothetical protein